MVDIELHTLDLRYAALRTRDRVRETRLAGRVAGLAGVVPVSPAPVTPDVRISRIRRSRTRRQGHAAGRQVHPNTRPSERMCS
jgi:hypothetical protein